MKAMILAAGLGTRMRPLTDHCPKPLLRAGGKPLIVHHVERLSDAGFAELVINLSWLGEQIEQALGDGRRWGVSIRYSREPRPLETAGGIRAALPLLGEAPFLLLNGDVWCDADLGAFAAPPLAGLARLLMVPNPPHHPEGDFLLHHDGRLTDADAAGDRLTYAGIAVIDPALVASLRPGEAAPLAPLLRRAMALGEVRGVRHQGRWLDVGTPARLAELDSWLGGNDDQS